MKSLEVCVTTSAVHGVEVITVPVTGSWSEEGLDHSAMVKEQVRAMMLTMPKDLTPISQPHLTVEQERAIQQTIYQQRGLL